MHPQTYWRTCQTDPASVHAVGTKPLADEDGGTNGVDTEHQNQAPGWVVVGLCTKTGKHGRSCLYTGKSSFVHAGNICSIMSMSKTYKSW